MLYMLMLFQWLPQAATCQVDIGAKVIFGQGGWDSCSGPSLRIKDFGHFCDDLTPILPGGFWMLKRYTLRLQCASGLQIKKATCYIVLIKYRYYHIDIIWDYQSPFFCWCIWSQNMKSETAPFTVMHPCALPFVFQRLGSETKASHVTWRWYGASHIFPPRPLAIQWNTVKPCESPTLRHRFESLLPWRHSICHSILYFYVYEYVLNFRPRVLDHSPSALHASSGSASHKRRKAKPVEVNRLVTDQNPKNLEPKTAQVSAVAGKLT